MAWTEERVALLTEYWEKGHTASQIADLLGEGLSRNAVIGKAHRLGLPARPSPLKSRKAAAKPRKAKKAQEGAPAAENPAMPTNPVNPASPAPQETAKGEEAPAKRAATPAEPLGERLSEPLGERLPDPLAEESSKSPREHSGKSPKENLVESPLTAASVETPAPAARPRPAKKRRNSKVTLLDLNDRICRWPIGHPDEADFHFCGKPVNPGFPYCPEHCLEAYQAQMPHRQGGAPHGQHLQARAGGEAKESQGGSRTPR